MKSNGDTISLKYYIVTLYQILINVLRWSAEASLHHIDKYWTKVFQQPHSALLKSIHNRTSGFLLITS
jgi:hypothetical protein